MHFQPAVNCVWGSPCFSVSPSAGHSPLCRERNVIWGNADIVMVLWEKDDLQRSFLFLKTLTITEEQHQLWPCSCDNEWHHWTSRYWSSSLSCFSYSRLLPRFPELCHRISLCRGHWLFRTQRDSSVSQICFDFIFLWCFVDVNSQWFGGKEEGRVRISVLSLQKSQDWWSCFTFNQTGVRTVDSWVSLGNRVGTHAYLPNSPFQFNNFMFFLPLSVSKNKIKQKYHPPQTTETKPTK